MKHTGEADIPETTTVNNKEVRVPFTLAIFFAILLADTSVLSVSPIWTMLKRAHNWEEAGLIAKCTKTNWGTEIFLLFLLWILSLLLLILTVNIIYASQVYLKYTIPFGAVVFFILGLILSLSLHNRLKDRRKVSLIKAEIERFYLTFGDGVIISNDVPKDRIFYSLAKAVLNTKTSLHYTLRTRFEEASKLLGLDISEVYRIVHAITEHYHASEHDPATTINEEALMISVDRCVNYV